MFETSDGGASWQRLADPSGAFPGQQLSAVNADHRWLVCGSQPAGTLQAKSVYFSTDAARSWRQTASVGLAKATLIGVLRRAGSIVGLAAVSDHDARLALGRGPVEATTDQGRAGQGSTGTWRRESAG